MGEYTPVHTIGVGPEPSINQKGGNLLTKSNTQRYQSIVGSDMYLAKVSRYDILHGVKQLPRATSNPSQTHMGTTKHLPRYLGVSIDFNIIYMQESSKLTAFSDANWGNNSNNGKLTYSYIMTMCNGHTRA